MELNLPHHLEGTCQLLHRSLGLRPNEVPPAIPATLMCDLQQRFTPTQRLIVEPPRRAENIFQQLLRVFSTPAVGATAIIVGVLSFAIPAMLQTDRPETFRGTSMSTHGSVPIYLTGGPLSMENVLASSGDLTPEAIVTIDSRDSAMTLRGPKVIVDFEAGEVLSIDVDGRVVARDSLPEDTGMLSLTIAQAVSRL